MTIEQIANIMYENEECQMVCMQDTMENVLFIGTLGELKRQHPKSLKAEIKTMFTERYKAFNGVSGLTIVI